MEKNYYQLNVREGKDDTKQHLSPTFEESCSQNQRITQNEEALRTISKVVDSEWEQYFCNRNESIFDGPVEWDISDECVKSRTQYLQTQSEKKGRLIITL